MPDGAALGAGVWGTLAKYRRLLLGVVVVASGSVAGWAFMRTLPPEAPHVLAVGLDLLFAVLFAGTAWGAATAVAGFLLLRRSRLLPSSSGSRGRPDSHPGRTAIVFPICDEDTD